MLTQSPARASEHGPEWQHRCSIFWKLEPERSHPSYTFGFSNISYKRPRTHGHTTQADE